MSLETLLSGIGTIGALAVIGGLIFAESAFLLGMFLPGGDTLLLISGVLAAEGRLPLVWVILVIFVAAIAGDNVGYTIGERAGPRIFSQQEGVLFRKEHAERATAFYQKHGGKTIVIARFIAYIRTFAPLLAGIGRMPRPKFVMYNIFGALFWTLSLVLVAYWLGRQLATQIERFIVPLSIVGAILLLTPSVLYFARNPRIHAKLMAWIRRVGRIVRR